MFLLQVKGANFTKHLLLAYYEQVEGAKVTYHLFPENFENWMVYLPQKNCVNCIKTNHFIKNVFGSI